jgi:Ca-activated chloride channel homolog
VSVANPLWLLGLLFVPGIWLLYRHRRDRARHFAVRFPATDTLMLAASSVPVWRRYLPALLALVALATLTVALAKPRATVSMPIDRTSIVLVTDHSSSMTATDVEPNRMAAAQSAANTFVDELPGRARVGIVTYATSVDATQAPSVDHDLTRRVIDGQVANGSTATGDAVATALQLVRSEGGNVPSAIVLLSDGKTTAGIEPVEVARQPGERKKIPVYTVALGTPGAVLQNPDPYGPDLDVSPDRETLRRIADVSGGEAFTADDSGRLESIYERLGSQLGTRKVKRELTAGFAVAGMLLLLGAGVASQRRPLRRA